MSGIWFQRPTPEFLNRLHENTACEALGIEIVEVGDDFIRGVMAVDDRTRQPYGLLHGGASLLLAETLASCAAIAVVDPERFFSVGTQVSAHHVRAATSGSVTGTARPLHLGRTSQLWEIDIVDESGRAVCLARMGASVISKHPDNAGSRS